ncbi:MAG: winged helix DNA-binding domain-containing protein [Paludisphaera borealis]|uniref:winged helix DNA-binding domain-containing protein n=1 Tax=Paludisphaera borealis TaxID=1387353 RepID=UPI00283CEB94|nr:winged helix DNA-binding domain-containing protein [Paludisphaera borealis]MDR3620755.1 winged helix DNA-binding domain-containing protein [Paludisphaera borealis]
MAAEVLTKQALNRALLARQMLLSREAATVSEVLERLLGLQAQEAAPPLIGLWTRIEGFQRDDLLRLLRDRAVVRATLLRGTLHLVSAPDYLAFRSTFQPMFDAALKAVLRDRTSGVDVAALVESGRRLFVEEPMTFTKMRAALIDLFPDGDERAMGYTVRMRVPLVSTPDDSKWGFGGDPEFHDAATWLGRAPGAEPRAEELVLRYLAAFGPAAAVDVQAWSGVGGAREVLNALRPRLQTFRDDRKRELFDLPDAPRPAAETPVPVRFLPGFDNVILGHADRSRIIDDAHRPKVTTKNLQVLPTFLVDGFVAGTWKISGAGAKAKLTLSPFGPMTAAAKAQLTKEGKELMRFVEPDASKPAIEFAAT